MSTCACSALIEACAQALLALRKPSTIRQVLRGRSEPRFGQGARDGRERA